MYTLYGQPGWGSVLVETQLAWYGLPYRLEEVGNIIESAAARERLLKVNPVGQLPTLVLPDGAIMTESAAITLYLADVTGSEALVPGPKDRSRAAFLRWLVFLVSNVYSTFTFADNAAHFVADEAARPGFVKRIEQRREHLWSIVEANVAAPWFLGERFSALDIYLGAMFNWTPGRNWFTANAPRIAAIARATGERSELAGIYARNFPA